MKIAVKIVDVLDFAAPVLVFVNLVDKQVLTAYLAKPVGGVDEGVGCFL